MKLRTCLSCLVFLIGLLLKYFRTLRLELWLKHINFDLLGLNVIH